MVCCKLWFGQAKWGNSINLIMFLDRLGFMTEVLVNTWVVVTGNLI